MAVTFAWQGLFVAHGGGSLWPATSHNGWTTKFRGAIIVPIKVSLPLAGRVCYLVDSSTAILFKQPFALRG
jgi:hypothetical protein